MERRGRKSAAALAVVARDAPLGAERLATPANLSLAEQQVWVDVINDHPAESFSATHIPMLEMYCRHVVRSRVLAVQIDAVKPEDLKDMESLRWYDKLLAMSEREGRAASSHATRLRITRQSIDQQTVAKAQMKGGAKSKPWQSKS